MSEHRTERAKSLTFYMGDKTDDELWEIIASKARADSRTWRAYEALRSRMHQISLRLEAAERRLSDESG